MARGAFPDICEYAYKLISPDCDLSTYQQTEQRSQPFFRTIRRASSKAEANQVNLPNRTVSAAVHSELTILEAPISVSTGSPVALLEISATQHSQSRHRAINPASAASGQLGEIRSNLTSSSVKGNTITIVGRQQGQGQPLHTSAMWPTDHAGPSRQVSKSRQRVDNSNNGVTALTQGYPPNTSVSVGSSRGHQRYQSHQSPLPQQYAASASRASGDRFSSDTRRGKERVERPCSKCGTKNHIRKKECINCKEPKEPPKKRVKRLKAKKKTAPSSASSGQRGMGSSAPRASQVQAGTQHGMPVGADAQVAGHDPREDILQSILDPNSNFTLPEAPSLPATSVEYQMPQGFTRSSRHPAFYETQNYDGGYRTLRHP